MFPRTIDNRLKIGRYVPILRHQSARIEPCGDGMFTTSDELVEILCFSHFTSYMTFLPTGKKGRKKQRKSSIEVSVALHLVTGDTSDSL